MKRPAVIFDIDKTLLIDDLPSFLYKNRIVKSVNIASGLPFSFLFFVCFNITRWRVRRLFEYWYENVIDNHRIVQAITANRLINEKVQNRLEKYLRLGYAVYLVTAAPKSISGELETLFKVKVIGSDTFNGFIVNDLMGKKEYKVYRKISEVYEIVAIYSDSIGDHSSLARYNYLVKNQDIFLRFCTR